MLERNHTIIRLAALAAFSTVLFAPLMGRGFILDDFGHLFVAGQNSVRFGLTRASGGPYYAPVAYVSFKLNWLLWGARPFPWAANNLLIHIANTLLIYWLALRLWRSAVAGWWAAFGFALLYPANVVGVMWIATRAHLIAAFFYVAAMIAALWFNETEQFKLRAAILVAVCAGFSMFAKESGVTVPVAVVAVIVYRRSCQARTIISPDAVLLTGTLLIPLFAYFWLRAQSGAIPINFSGGPISYTFSPSIWGQNLITYGWRTYGLLAFVALAVMLHSRNPIGSFGSFSKIEIGFSLTLFAIALAPVLLLPKQPGIYSYLPGVAAALLLGAMARSFHQGSTAVRPAEAAIRLAPVFLVVALYVGLALLESISWIRLAETNTRVLNRIAAEQPKIGPNTLVVLSYAEVDGENGFPDGFSTWCFPWALRVLYMDRTIDGAIVHRGQPYVKSEHSAEIHFEYVRGESPKVVKTGEL